VDDDVKFPIIVDIRQTIEYLAQQIEAEYTYRFLKNDDPNRKKANPLICGLMYNSSMIALRFDDVIGEVLTLDSDISVVNLYEEAPAPTIKEEQTEEVKFTSENTVPQINIELSEPQEALVPQESFTFIPGKIYSVQDLQDSSDKSSSEDVRVTWQSNYGNASKKATEALMDDNFHKIFKNKLLLQSFIEHCISDHNLENLLFCIDVEVFQSCTDLSARILLAFYIYQLYIMENAPLRINLTAEIRGEITLPTLTSLKTLDIVMYDDAQCYVLKTLRKISFPAFSKTKGFLNLQGMRVNGNRIYILIPRSKDI
jgi:hypothetical protein